MRNKFKEWLTRHLSGCVRWPCAALAAIALLAAPLTSQAHARLVRSNPTDGAVLPNSPRQIELWFNELLEDGFNVVEVFPATSTPGQQRVNLAKNKAIVDGKERTHVTLELQPLSPGEYVVEFRVLSKDGHSAPGKLRFRIRSPAPSAP